MHESVQLCLKPRGLRALKPFPKQSFCLVPMVISLHQISEKKPSAPNALTVETTLQNSSGTIVLYIQPPTQPREVSLGKWTKSDVVNPLFWVDQATNKDNVNATMSSNTFGEFKIPFPNQLEGLEGRGT